MTTPKTAPSEPMNLTNSVRCALARHDAGHAWEVDPEDVARLLADYDRLAVPRSDVQTEHASPRDWTPEQFWEYAEGLTDTFTCNEMHRTMADRGLRLASTVPSAQCVREEEEDFCAACGRHRSVHPYDLCGIFIPRESSIPSADLARDTECDHCRGTGRVNVSPFSSTMHHCDHAKIICMDGEWHCQRCGAAVSSTHPSQERQ